MPVLSALLDDTEDIAPPAGGGALSANSVPGCTMIQQEVREWCWAAVTQTIAGVRGNAMEQCAIAQRVMPSKACCDDKESCDVSQDLAHVLSICAIPCTSAGGKVDLQRIIDAIDGGRPVACRIQFPSTQHLIIISAYEGDHLTFLDPAFDDPMQPNEQPYSGFLIRYQDSGHWNETYFV